MSCPHEKAKTIETFPFRSISLPRWMDENPAARGNATYVEECEACGARREYNQNGNHIENGPWQGSTWQREEREKHNREIRNKIRRLKQEKQFRNGDTVVRVGFDDDGVLGASAPIPEEVIDRMWPRAKQISAEIQELISALR